MMRDVRPLFAYGQRRHPGHQRHRSGYTGHEHDGEAGLINMRGRIYDPTFARFLTADPVIQAPCCRPN
jgi:RHS repeat-associated protein